MREPAVYSMANKPNGTLYTGVTLQNAMVVAYSSITNTVKKCTRLLLAKNK